METVEIRYFLETARLQSVRKAAEAIGVSPSAISKAIGRLERELEVKLIEKVGRNLALTKTGKHFEKQGAEFLALENKIIKTHKLNTSNQTIKIVGPELPLSYWGTRMMKGINKAIPKANIHFEATSNQEGLSLVDGYGADLTIYTSQEKMKRDSSLIKKIDTVSMKTFVSKKHALSHKRKVSVNDIIKDKFVVTNHSALSLFFGQLSSDGWLDHKFQRENVIYTDSLKILDTIIKDGHAISYLPDFYGEELGLKELNIHDCPFHCKFSVYACRNKYGLDDIWNLI